MAAGQQALGRVRLSRRGPRRPRRPGEAAGGDCVVVTPAPGNRRRLNYREYMMENQHRKAAIGQPAENRRHEQGQEQGRVLGELVDELRRKAGLMALTRSIAKPTQPSTFLISHGARRLQLWRISSTTK